MKSRGRKTGLALMIMTLVTFATACGNNENDKSNADTSEMTHMEIKELEQKILSKNWDALDIVDTASRPEESLDLLTELVGHEDPEVREIALNCVSMVRDARVPKMLAGSLSDKDDDIRLFALQSLQTAYDESILGDLIANLENEDAEIRGGVALLLGEIGNPEAVEPLKARLEPEENMEAERDMKLALARLGDAEMQGFFADQMDVPDSDTRLQGLEDLRYIQDKSLSYRIMPALDDTGDGYPVTPPGEPEAEYNRVCDVAINYIAELHDQPFSFEVRETKIYSDEEIEQVKSFLATLKSE